MVDAFQLNDDITVRCIFERTLSERCYVQLVSGVMGGFHKVVYLEGEDETSYSFTGLTSGTYTVLVYGQSRETQFCSPPGDPDYITAISVGATQSNPNTPATTNETGIMCNIRPYD